MSVFFRFVSLFENEMIFTDSRFAYLCAIIFIAHGITATLPCNHKNKCHDAQGSQSKLQHRGVDQSVSNRLG